MKNFVKDKSLQNVVCARCKYHLYCTYSKDLRGRRLGPYVLPHFFDPDGILFGCKVRTDTGFVETTIDMPWELIHEAGEKAHEEVQQALRNV